MLLKAIKTIGGYLISDINGISDDTIYLEIKAVFPSNEDEFTPEERQQLHQTAIEMYDCQPNQVTDDMMENIAWMKASHWILQDDDIWGNDIIWSCEE